MDAALFLLIFFVQSSIAFLSAARNGRRVESSVGNGEFSDVTQTTIGLPTA
jgi:hypothetical protein